MNNHFDKMKGVVNELKAIGRPIDDEDFIIAICNGLGLDTLLAFVLSRIEKKDLH